MTAHSITKQVGFVSATVTSLAEELTGHLAAFRPIEDRVLDTKHGDSTATITQIVLIGADGTTQGLGERAVFWHVVRRQLARATSEAPWVVGRLVQSGQAYRLDPLEDDDTGRVQQALDQLTG